MQTLAAGRACGCAGSASLQAGVTPTRTRHVYLSDGDRDVSTSNEVIKRSACCGCRASAKSSGRRAAAGRVAMHEQVQSVQGRVYGGVAPLEGHGKVFSYNILGIASGERSQLCCRVREDMLRLRVRCHFNVARPLATRR
jgi:hypothetical protein